MKTYKQNQKTRAVQISRGAELPETRKVVFKRLKPPPSLWKWLRFPFVLILKIAHSAEIHRILDPEKPPVPEHDWKRPTIFRPRI